MTHDGPLCVPDDFSVLWFSQPHFLAFHDFLHFASFSSLKFVHVFACLDNFVEASSLRLVFLSPSNGFIYTPFLSQFHICSEIFWYRFFDDMTFVSLYQMPRSVSVDSFRLLRNCSFSPMGFFAFIFEFAPLFRIASFRLYVFMLNMSDFPWAILLGLKPPSLFSWSYALHVSASLCLSIPRFSHSC